MQRNLRSLKNDQSGFSMLWLLLVLGVVVLLVAGFLYLDPLELAKKARDQSRISDLESLNKALQVYLRNNASDPFLCQGCKEGSIFAYSSIGGFNQEVKVRSSISAAGSGWIPVDFSLNAGFNETPLLRLPTDPTNKEPYVYTFTAGANGKYKLTAKLEASTNQGKMADDGGNRSSRYEIGTDLDFAP